MSDGWATEPPPPPRMCHRCGDSRDAAPIIERDADVGWVPTVLCRDRLACAERVRTLGQEATA